MLCTLPCNLSCTCPCILVYVLTAVDYNDQESDKHKLTHSQFNGWKAGVLPKLLTGSTACYSHDVGDCTGATFNSSMNVANCQAPLSIKEDVDGPLDAMPGCNPISTVTSNVKRLPCAIGVVGGTGVAAVVSSSTTLKSSSKTSSTTTSKKIAATSSVIKAAAAKSSSTTSSVCLKDNEAITVLKTQWATKTVTVTKEVAPTAHKRSVHVGQMVARNYGHARHHDF